MIRHRLPRAIAAAALAAGLLGAVLVTSTPAGAAVTIPTVTLASNANPSKYSQRIVLSATAAMPGQTAAATTGTMTFNDGVAVLGTVTVTNGKATLATRALGTGTHALTASYLATGATATVESASITQTVGQANTTTAVVSSRPTANYGNSGAITALVKAVLPANAIPTGTVDFYVDGGWYWSAPLDATGKATWALTDLYPSFTPGTYTITASYSGDGDFAPSATITGIAQTLVGITSTPVSTVTLNAKAQPVFTPSSFTLSSYNPVGCNVSITNTTPNTLLLTYGTPGNWKRLPFGSIAPGATGGVGVGLANYTGYFSAVGAANYVKLTCT